MKLYLHIGMPRAASTYIQNVIYKLSVDDPNSIGLLPHFGKRARLLKVVYEEYENVKNRGYIVNNKNLNTKKNYYLYKEKLTESIKKNLTRSNNFFVSEETLFFIKKEEIQKIQKFFQDLECEVILCIMKRDINDFIKSAYKHRVALTNYDKNLDAFSETFLQNNSSDINGVIKLWEETTNWETRVFHFNDFKNNNSKVFKELFDLEPKFDLNFILNASLKKETIKIKLMINKILTQSKTNISADEHTKISHSINNLL